MYLAYAACDVAAPPFVTLHPFSVPAVSALVIERNAVLGIANVIEVYAVYVVFAYYFGAQVGQVIVCTRHSGVHHPLVACLSAKFRAAAWQRLLSELPCHFHVHQRKGYYPRLYCHAPFVALVYGECKGVVTRRNAGTTRQAAVPRLYVRRIYHGSPYARLQQHGIDSQLVQTVELFA